MKKTERIGIRISPEEKEQWTKLAEQSGLSLSAWISAWCNEGTRIMDKFKNLSN